jgi:ABC-type glycerol-3-phosphate transport system substrate-binding protein
MAKLKTIFSPKRVITLLVVIIVFVFFVFSQNNDISYIEIQAENINHDIYQAESYDVVARNYQLVDGVEVVVQAADFGVPVIDGTPLGYTADVVQIDEGETVSIDVTVPTAGAYEIVVYQKDNTDSILRNEISVMINGEFPYVESEIIELPIYWEFSVDDFNLDRYGNEIQPNSVKVDQWYETALSDKTGLNARPLLFEFNAGSNTIDLEVENGSIYVGYVAVVSAGELPTYEAYKSQFSGDVIGDITIVGAEEFTMKNDPSIGLMSERDPSATSYDTKDLRLNAINGQSFKNGTDEIVYEVEVAEDGFYHIGFKYKQDYVMQMPVFREIRINGEVPFEEVAMYPFQYTTEYQNMILNNGEDDYQFYFTAGQTHTITLRVVLEPYRNAYYSVIGVMNEITDLSLEIKKLTGNTTDQYRRWDLNSFIDDIDVRFARWNNTLDEVIAELSTYTHHDNPGMLTNIVLAQEQLADLSEDIDDIPNKMIMLADGDSSAAQMLGSSVQSFLENGLDLEKMYLGGEDLDALPRARANVFVNSWESTKRFFFSFTDNDYAVSNVEEGVLEVWVNHPRQYIEIMQEMIDGNDGFTNQYGTKVQLSLMPDENKLILANSADIAPDVALGVNHWIPYEFAIRDASLDLRQFDGYEELVSEFSPGVMIPFVFEDGLFGFPQTQNFWVTYYRTDIFEALNLEVPGTWEEVVEILPELQRYGMNYYQPLAFFKGFKPFVATIPFIYQFDGTLYAEDGMSTLINSEETLEGMKLMTDLFTVYNMPTEIPNFYNHFRYGTLPIGISDLGTYLTLTIAAPELKGKWDIAPHPGVEKENGEIERWAASGAQANMILSSTEMPEKSWEFLSWWMSSGVQAEFAQRLQTTYGNAYLWNTANLVAFEQLPIPTAHKEVILAQWEYAMEASRIPGAYMVEREISNAWNTIVFDDANPRITLDQAVKTANREILYKMEEFGYVENGVVLRPYLVPTIDNIGYWLEGRDD